MERTRESEEWIVSGTETWMSNRFLINGLWPDADFTDEEKELYNTAFSDLNQDWLKRAIEKAAMNNVGKKPYIKWIKAEFKKVKEQNAHTDFKKEIHQKAETPSDFNQQFVVARKYIQTFEPETIEECAEIVRRKTGIAIDITDDVENWSKMAVGMMATVLEEKGNGHG